MFRLLILTGVWLIGLSGNAQSPGRVEELFETAENQLNSGEYEKAIQSFGKVIALKVNNVDAYYYRAVAKEKCNDTEGALVDYSLALEWQNDFAEAMLRRARLFYKLGRYDEAKADFEKLLTIPQGETHDIIYRKSSYEQGINRIITAQGATDIIFNYLGLIAIRQEHYEQAITLLDRAINLFNADADYYVTRGIAYEHLLNFAAAKADFEMALVKTPDHALAHQHLSELSRRLGDVTASNRYLDEAIEQNPHLPYAYLERAFYRCEAGNFAGGVEDYSAALSIDSLDADVWVNRGLAYEKLGELNAAYNDYTHAITLSEAYGNAWLCRANILTRQGKLKEALEDYSIAILYVPDYALAFYNRALIRHRMGEKTIACEDLKKAADLGQPVPENVQAAICGGGS